MRPGVVDRLGIRGPLYPTIEVLSDVCRELCPPIVPKGAWNAEHHK